MKPAEKIYQMDEVAISFHKGRSDLVFFCQNGGGKTYLKKANT